MIAKTAAERQRSFKEAQTAAGMVRLDLWVTKEERDKLALLGGAEWIRKKIKAARVQG